MLLLTVEEETGRSRRLPPLPVPVGASVLLLSSSLVSLDPVMGCLPLKRDFALLAVNSSSVSPDAATVLTLVLVLVPRPAVVGVSASST